MKATRMGLFLIAVFISSWTGMASAAPPQPVQNLINNVTSRVRQVPEPTTLLLVGGGLVGFAAWRKWQGPK
ncbi:MAG: PEP-CTERM sorting domain-containing protein [Nitrospirae bacterium]|nr:PEP-CTERM sorting domain-containing protein [Candidatus Manganitrophaceae bacterium]